jgi:hypothetical protein
MLVTKHWDLVKKLMASNEYHSNKAHELSKDLPLIALAIFGASRRIEYSDLKVEGSMTHLEGSRKDFETRVRRNRLILEAAMNAAKSLKDTYEKTLERLKKYKAGNRDILRPQVPDEKPSLEDAEQYFAEGNWARPLIIARKLFESLGGTALSKANEGLLYPVTSTICKALAMRDAAGRKCHEALWFNTENQLAEGSICNAFVVQGEAIVTPPLDTPVLPGITRAAVIELAAALGIRVREAVLTFEDTRGADELFLTNSMMEVMPVGRIGREPIGNEKPGDTTRRLAVAYSDLVARECGGA